MRLVRFGNSGEERPGILDADDRIRDLSGIVTDIDGATLSPASLRTL
jgi:5-carboxymethyl-2-hydroxymuconate isomerase